ncbi:hypothetical protein UA08_04923 [Talaromyces atroroseus]|uniref:Uncharacterized protein n=1 Tax=Talaromyces atroroseus TaxID=1441469 RepID=A0A225AXP1_TALAT|nr:hypothetical protein UA08_04923 [Talaromyces atroroseus]OKL59746.1 hypothetical protein UA08_04923 [Talaromyces atroroseus]
MFKLPKSRFSTVVSDSSSRISSMQSFDMKRDTSEPNQRKGKELQTQVSNLWRIVWLGLYQLHDNHGPYHVDRLVQLYFGAGMAVYDILDKVGDSYERSKSHKGPLGLLGYALSNRAISNLRLYEGLSIDTLKSVIQLLEAYKHEIASLGEVYELLRSLQVGLRTPTSNDEKAVLEHYPPLADQLARRLVHLDARLDVLMAELEDEHMESFGDSPQRNGWLVRDMVYPNILSHSGMSRKIS